MAQRQFRTDDTDAWGDGYGPGADGAYSTGGSGTYSAENESCSGTLGSASVTLGAAGSFANGDLVMIHQSRGTGVGVWELNKILSGGGTTSLTMAYNLTNTYTDSGASQAQMVEMKTYTSAIVNSGHTIAAPAWDENKGGIIAFFSKGTTTIEGSFNLDAKGYVAGAGEAGSPSSSFNQGEGTTGTGGTNSTSRNGTGGGGGDTDAGNQTGGGAGGGNGTAGSNGGSTGGTSGGTGGLTSGSTSLVTATFGGAGGAGAAPSVTSRTGGRGGGLILIISKTITATGNTILRGGDGGDGRSGVNESGAGAGAGGSAILKGQVLTLGTGKFLASGGTGGIAGTSGVNSAGGNGGTGRIHADYSESISGTTTPTLDSSQDAILADSSSGSAAMLLMQM